MPSYTTSLRLVQPATGEYSGTWGTQVNTGITALVDSSIAGTTSITMTAANYTLTTANGASDESRAMFLVLGGTPGAAREVIVPAVSKLYFVTNSTTGGFAQTVKTASGSGISVPNGARMTLRCDGTDVVVAQNYFASMTLGAALPTASGGTGLTSFTSGGVVYASSSSALATGSGLVFDGTNLGVGTSSPAQRLDVTGVQNSVQARFGNVTGRGLEIGTALIAGTNDAGSVLNAKGATSGTMIFQTDSTERMRLDASGNLGLGVTPSAWWSGRKSFQFGGSGNSSFVAASPGTANYAELGSNYFTSATPQDVYYATGTATRYIQNGGAHQWYTAPSGTAGNAISFTQAMTLDASGNLLLGTTTASDGRATITAIANYNDLATGYSLVLSNSAGTGSNSNPINVGVIQFGNPIVTNNDLGRLSVVQENPGAGTQSSMRFFTNGGGGNTQTLERARITSGGDLLVGTTDAAINSGTGVKLKAGANNNINAVGSDTTNTTSNYNLYSTGAAAYRFYVGMGGTIYATSTTITAISDQRLKENIRDLDAGLPEIMALKPRKFDWKAGKGKDKKNDRGWIAQEFEQVFPDMVDTWQDPAPEGEEPYKAVNADLIPVLVKAIQEQQALITDLRARVAALEQA